MARTVTLGGEIESRGVFGGRTVLDLNVLAVALITGVICFYTVGHNSWVSFLVGGLIWALGYGITFPAAVFLSGRSLVNYFAQWAGRKTRRLAGQNIFVPSQNRQSWADEQRAADEANPKLKAAAVRRRAITRARRWGLQTPVFASPATKTKPKNAKGSVQAKSQKKKASAAKKSSSRTPNALSLIHI